MLDVVFSELRDLLRFGFVGLGCRSAASCDFDLNGNLKPEPRELGLLPPQLRLSRIDLAARQLYLIAVGHRIDFRNNWPCSTRSFSSTKKRTRCPDTDCGATLMIWASTKASSVIECVKR